MTQVVLTGKPNCQYCDFLAKVMEKLGVEFTKVNLMEDEAWLAKAKEGGNTMPACIFVGDARYAVSTATPAKPTFIKAWLEEQGVAV